MRPSGPLFTTLDRRQSRLSPMARSALSDFHPLAGLCELRVECRSACPLKPMTEAERLVADYAGTGLTVGRHPMALRREELATRGVLRACDLAHRRGRAAACASPAWSSRVSGPARRKGLSSSRSRTRPASPTSSCGPISSPAIAPGRRRRAVSDRRRGASEPGRRDVGACRAGAGRCAASTSISTPTTFTSQTFTTGCQVPHIIPARPHPQTLFARHGIDRLDVHPAKEWAFRGTGTRTEQEMLLGLGSFS